MHFYSGTLLELLAVNNDSEKPQTTVMLTLEESVQLIWELDKSTADQLASIVKDGRGTYKYRLSLLSFWDSIQNHYYSSVSRTYRDQSDQIFFPCSKAYIERLNEIKSLTHIRELKKSSITVENEIVPLPKKARKLQYRLALAVLTLTTALLLGFSSYSYFNQSAVAQNALDQETTPNNTIQETIPKAQQQLLPVREEIEAVEFVEQKEMLKFPTIELSNLISYRIPDGSVALTFDDGPSKYTSAFVDVLNEYDAGATFFFIGQNVKQYPEAIEYVHSNGFSIGNHSTDHALFLRLNSEEQMANITETNQLIEQLTGEPVALFRPPYGANNPDTSEILEQSQMKMVLWNSDTEDWKAKNDKDILEYIVTTKTSGSIILLHETQETLQALPQIIEYLRENQLEIVNLK